MKRNAVVFLPGLSKLFRPLVFKPLVYCLIVPAILNIGIYTPASADYALTEKELNARADQVNWLPGEQYNPYFGSMNHRTIDMSLPGNGKLPMKILRTYSQSIRGRIIDKVWEETVFLGTWILQYPV